MMSVVSLSAGFLNNFEKHAAVNTTVEYSYDHSSVMHYGSRFFRLVLFWAVSLVTYKAAFRSLQFIFYVLKKKII